MIKLHYDLSTFKFWCYKVLPLVYDDSLSYYEVLCKVVNYINNLIDQDKIFGDGLTKLGDELTKLKEEFGDELTKLKEDLDGELTKLKEDLDGELTKLKEDLAIVQEWIDNYDTTYVKNLVEKFIANMIYVDISDSGYIIYHVPESWNDIKFYTTGLNITVPTENEYGHLVLSLYDNLQGTQEEN